MAMMDPLVVFKLFFNLDMPKWTVIFRYIFELMPSFHFTKIYANITRVTATHITFGVLVWEQGRAWRYEDFFLEEQGVFTTKDRYHVYSFYDSLVKVSHVSLGYFLLALYFDNIFSSNRGTSQPALFFLNPNYWLSYLKVTIKFGGSDNQVHAARKAPIIEKLHGH